MKKIIISILILALISILASAWFYYDRFDLGYWENASDWGAMGSFFGGVLGPAFTFLTMLLLAYTLFQNKKALEQSQKALEFNNQELEISGQALKSSSEALHSQTIGNTFFNLINQHNNIVNSLNADLTLLKKETGELSKDTTESKNTVNGRGVFTGIITTISYGNTEPTDTFKYYKLINSTHNYLLGHYFRNLFQIIKYIDEYSDLEVETRSLSEARQAQKKNFMRMIRAQLSADELILLLLNCIPGVVDNGQFRMLLVKYEMLKHIVIKHHNSQTKIIIFNPRIMIDESHFQQFIIGGKSAFGDNSKYLEILKNITDRQEQAES